MANQQGAPGAAHFVLQGKGGVGKSLVAATLMQYLRARLGASHVAGADSDPANQTLAGYEALGVRHLPILREGTSRVDEGRFDELISWMVENPAAFVVDTGATSFLPFSNYLLENDILDLLRAQGRTVRVHTVITGGQSLLDTIDGFANLADSLPPQSMVVWLNEYFGPIQSRDGRGFHDSKAYLDRRDKILGLVHWSQRNPDTFGRDMRDLLQRRLTFAEGIASEAFSIVSRQRFKIVSDEIFSQLDAIAALSTAPVLAAA